MKTIKRLILTGAIAFACAAGTAAADDNTYDIHWNLVANAGALRCVTTSGEVTVSEFNDHVEDTGEGGVAALTCSTFEGESRKQGVHLAFADGGSDDLTKALVKADGMSEELEITVTGDPVYFSLTPGSQFTVRIAPARKADLRDVKAHVTRVRVVNEYI